MNVTLKDCNMLSMITLKVLHKSFYDIFYMKQVVILYTPRLVTQFPPLIVSQGACAQIRTTSFSSHDKNC